MKVRLAPVLALLSFFAAVCHAQTNAGVITGIVLDAQGAAVAGADVTLVEELTGVRTETKTASAGTFVFPSVQPGKYTVLVQASGFKRVEKTGYSLSSQERLAVAPITLEIGNVNEAVTVTAEVTPVQTSSMERSGLLNETQMQHLSTPGRDYLNLIKLMPGVTYPGNGSAALGNSSPPIIGGVRSDYIAINIDGVVANNRGLGTTENTLNLDAVAEVKVLQSNYQAEYGKNAGAIINIVSKTGTRDFHGTGYWYKRHESLNANKFFNNQAGLPRDIYRYNTYGGNIGGPIFFGDKFNREKDKLFFFFSAEQQPNKRPGGQQKFTTPTELERKGDFSQSFEGSNKIYIKDPLLSGTCSASSQAACFPGNIIPPNRINPQMQRLLNVFPLPNFTDAAARAISNGNYNLLLTDTIDAPVHQELLRVDYNPTDKIRTYFRGMFMAVGQRGTNITANSNKWGVKQTYDTTNPNVAYNVTFMASPTLVNELSLGVSRWTEVQDIEDSELAKLQRAKLGINVGQLYPVNNPLDLIPAASFGGPQNAISIGYDSRFPMKDIVNAASVSDSLTKVWGKHTFKAGVYFEIAEYLQAHTGGSFTGTFNFGRSSTNPFDSQSPFSNALLGNFQNYTEVTRRIDYDPVNKVLEWYVQDNWKVNRHLTLDLGVRFTADIPQIFKKDIGGNFDFNAYDRSKLPLLYVPGKDAAGKRVAVDPRNGSTYPDAYIGFFIPGTGDPGVGSIAAGTPGYPRGFVNSNGVVPAPRIGFAYDPVGDGKTAIRGGFGIVLNARPRSGQQGDLASNPPSRYTPQQFFGNVSTFLSAQGLLAPQAFGRILDANSPLLSTYSMSFGIQRDIGFHTVVDVAYVGNLGRHLGQQIDINKIPYGAHFLPSSIDPTTGKSLPDNFLRPIYGYAAMPFFSDASTSSYHSLQATARHSFSNGLQFGAAYTWSKAMNYGDDYNSSIATYNNPRYWNYGPAGYDRTHTLTANWVYNLPNASKLVKSPVVKGIFDNWQISGIYAFVTGAPEDVSFSLVDSGTDLSGGGDGSTVVMTGNARLSSGERSFYRWFDTSVFQRPGVGVRGAGAAATRDAYRDPAINNFDLTFFKNIPIRERVKLQFRWEMYNAFNHTQFSGADSAAKFDANGVQTNKSFGQLTSARDPRIQQLSLRLSF